MKLSKIAVENSFNPKLLSKQKAQFRQEMQQALSKEGGLVDGEPGPVVQALIDRWMEDPRSVLSAEDIEFILDDETLFSEEDDF